MDQCRQAEAVVDIRVDVGPHDLARVARGLDPGQCLLHLGPVRAPGRLEVEDVHRGACGLADGERLVDRLEQPIAFIPHVGIVTAAVRGDDLVECDDLFGRGIDGRRIDQRSRQADRARLHRLADQALHPLELRGRCLAVDVADRDRADLGVPDRLDHIQRHPGTVEPIEVLGHRRPAGRRASSPASGAADSPSPALIVVIPCVSRLSPACAVLEERARRLAHHVDEPGGDHQPPGVDRPACRHGAQASHGDDPAGANRHVTHVPGGAAAVDDPAAAEDEVVRLLRGCSSEGRDPESNDADPATDATEHEADSPSHSIERLVRRPSPSPPRGHTPGRW